MSFAVKIRLLSSGLFLPAGTPTGVPKYRPTMRRAARRPFVSTSRTALLYSSAMMVAAERLEYNPCAALTQPLAAGLTITFFAPTFARHLAHGLKSDADDLFRAEFFDRPVYVSAHSRARRRSPASFSRASFRRGF